MDTKWGKGKGSGMDCEIGIDILLCTELMPSNRGAGEDSRESLDSKEITPVNPKGNHLVIHWKD